MLEEYIGYLQNSLGNEFLVCEEEKVDYDTDKILCIVKNISSANYRDSVHFVVQLEFLTQNVVATMQRLTEWSWEQNEQQISFSSFNFCKQVVSQPVNNSNFVQLHENYIGTIQIGINLIASFNGLDFKAMYIDGELFSPLQIEVAYGTTPDTQRNNKEELNSTNINESTLQIAITNVFNATKLFKKVREISFGKSPKNVDFEVKIVWTDEEETTTKFKLLSSSFSSERSALPSTTITLIH